MRRRPREIDAEEEEGLSKDGVRVEDGAGAEVGL